MMQCQDQTIQIELGFDMANKFLVSGMNMNIRNDEQAL